MDLTKEEFFKEFKQIEKITKDFRYNSQKDCYYKLNKSISRRHIVIKCKLCNKLFMAIANKNNIPINKFCSNSCKSKKLWKDPEFRKMKSEMVKKQWEDLEYRKMQSEGVKKLWKDPEFRKMKSEGIKKLWEDLEYRKMKSEGIKKLWKDQEFRKMQSEWSKKQWEDPEFRKMQSEGIKKLWKDQIFINKIKIYNKIHKKIFNKILKQKYPNLYNEYMKLKTIKNKTEIEKNRYNCIYNKIYKNNPKIQSLIKMEVEYRIKQINKPLTNEQLKELVNH